MKAVLILAVSLLTVAVCQSQEGSAAKSSGPRRRALLVGNQAYSNARLSKLAATTDEIDRVRKALDEAGFTVSVASDVKHDEWSRKIQPFIDQSQPGDICFFYYSGYAAQNDDDDYLLPIDFDPAADTFQNAAYPVTNLLQYLGVKKVGLKMVFLEGARKINGTVSDAKRPGIGKLADTNGLHEYLFFIPTLANRTIDTAPDQVGLFTATLAGQIRQPGSCLSKMLIDIPRAVKEKSDGKQEPTSDSQLTQEFCFHEAPPPPPLTTQQQRRQNRTNREFYVWIPPGTFMMGCVPGDKKCDGNELPQHKVTLLNGFWMAENEVRVTTYMNFLYPDGKKRGKKPVRKEPDADRKVNKNWEHVEDPINSVTWDDAVAYCTWSGGRLPTEAEWEWAARGGKDGAIYPLNPKDPEDARNKANFSGEQGNDHYEFTSPVRSFDPGPFGLYDMAGNVWEFVSDCFGNYPKGPVTDPKNPEKCKDHVRRGGSYDSDPVKHLRISLREKASGAWPNVGFRCVMDDNSDTQKILQKP